MKVPSLVATFIVSASSSPLAFSADATACVSCHDRDEFSGMDTADIVAAATDTDIPLHRRFAELSTEELQSIAEELSGG